MYMYSDNCTKIFSTFRHKLEDHQKELQVKHAEEM